MTLGRAPEQEDVWQTTARYCSGKLSPTSIFELLHRECHRLFPDDAFADLFRDIGRRSVPPRIVAVVMVLQRLEGLSDREAVERSCTTSKSGRSIRVHEHERILRDTRAHQKSPAWRASYKATRPRWSESWGI
jgi:hypothetical protein